MAGSLAIVPREEVQQQQQQKPAAAAIGEQWEVQYSRYIKHFSGSTASAGLAPLTNIAISRSRGSWLSSSSSIAVLELLADRSSASEAVLVVSFGGKIQEEHFLHKLRFSWPQVSCVSGYPSRGSRVVFVSYIDSGDQIQKFALRFSTAYQAQMFIDALKAIFTDGNNAGLLSGQPISDISAQSELTPSSRTPYRASNQLSLFAPTHTCTSEMLPSINYNAEQNSVSEETAPSPNTESILAGLPPSFTSLLTNCASVQEQGPTLPAEVDLKAEVMKFIGDSSFHDMLNKVEQVIGEMGYGMML